LKTNLYLIRHGEVENPEGIEYMRLPGFGLSKKGREQMLTLSKKLKNKSIDLIYASPLQRTKESAKILSENISSKKIPIKYSQELLEANYKKWQGIKRNERNKKELDGYWKDPIKYSAILGESLVCIQKRMTKKIIEIADKYPGRNIAILSHCDPIMTVRLFFEERSINDFWRVEAKHASVTLIVLDDELKCNKVEYREYIKAEGRRK